MLNFENNTNWQMIVISVRVAAFVLLEHNSFSCFLVVLGQILKVMNFFLPHLVSKIWHRKKEGFSAFSGSVASIELRAPSYCLPIAIMSAAKSR